MELDWTIVLALSDSPWPYRWVRLEKYVIRATSPQNAEGEAVRAALEAGYEVLNACWVYGAAPTNRE